MIEQFISKEVWQEVLKRAMDRKDLPESLIEHWVKSPVSTDYLEGCAVGLLTFTQALFQSGRTDKGYIHWLAQKTSANLILVLHQRGFKPYGELDNVPSQAEMDAIVKELLKQLGDEPPPPEKIRGI